MEARREGSGLDADRGRQPSPGGSGVKLRLLALFALTMAGQRALGTPGLPAWCPEIQLPVVWIVGPALRFEDRRWWYWAVLLGLCWDVVGSPVIGPGGIAWSAAALTLSALAAVIADRSYRAWVFFGAVAAVVVTLVDALALVPLGLSTTLTGTRLLRTAMLSGVWSGLVGGLLAADFPGYWRAYRLRKLR